MRRRRRRRRDADPAASAEPVAPAPTDPERVLATLAAHGVEYVVIGGVAVQAHGHVRTTLDLDLLAAPEPANLERLGAALRALDARLLGVDADLLGIDPGDPRDLASGANFTLATAAGRVDLWTDPAELKGARPWPELRSRALPIDLGGGRRVLVVGLDDLIRMKHAAGRPQDLDDIAALSDRGRDRDPPPASDR